MSGVHHPLESTAHLIITVQISRFALMCVFVPSSRLLRQIISLSSSVWRMLCMSPMPAQLLYLPDEQCYFVGAACLTVSAQALLNEGLIPAQQLCCPSNKRSRHIGLLACLDSGRGSALTVTGLATTVHAKMYLAISTEIQHMDFSHHCKDFKGK